MLVKLKTALIPGAHRKAMAQRCLGLSKADLMDREPVKCVLPVVVSLVKLLTKIVLGSSNVFVARAELGKWAHDCIVEVIGGSYSVSNNKKINKNGSDTCVHLCRG